MKVPQQKVVESGLYGEDRPQQEPELNESQPERPASSPARRLRVVTSTKLYREDHPSWDLEIGELPIDYLGINRDISNGS